MRPNHLRRREFITLLGGTAAAWPLPLNAQQAKVWRVGWIWIGRSGGISPEQAANGLNLFVRSFPARSGEEIEPAIAALARDRVDCMYIQPAPPVPAFVQEIGALLLKHRMPAISELRQLAESGGLLSYGPNLFESTRRQAYFVDRILKGTKPTDLPVEQPTKFEFVINLRTAKALGLQIPDKLLALADEVID